MVPTLQSPDLGEIHLTAGPDFFDDYPEQWLGFGSVEEEILRGAGLRIHKPDYRITDNVAYEIPIATEFEKKKKKKYSKRSDAIKTTPCSPRPCSPSICRNSPTPTDMCFGGTESSSNSFHHYWKKCPLRIAELAQPKKRQCIENIKDNAHRLPPIMLERLRQRVNDERPLAEIPDAIDCFKIRRPPRRPKSIKEWKIICNNIQREHLKRMEMRNLCVVFGHGIVTKLAVPMIISLNSELERLSAIVEYDISKVMTCKKLICDTNDNDCEKIRKEIADKVTAWIAIVIEESKDRLIDEDVKEMEDQIGPVLDFVDDLVNTVMGSVATEDNDNDSYMEALGSDYGGTSKSKYDTANSENESEDTATTIPISNASEFYSKIRPINKENDEEYMENININDDGGVNLYGLNDRAPVDKNIDIGNVREQTDAEINAEPDEVKEYKNVGTAITSSEFVNNVVKRESQPNKNQTKKYNTIVGILQKENSIDDKNKTVKFSNIDMVIDEPIGDPDESIISFNKLLDYKYLPVKNYSIYDSYPLDSELAPPNENLLSEADELWPDDIATPGMTISADVTHSICSLGKIVENDQELADDNDGSKKSNTEITMLITDLNTLNRSNSRFINDNLQKTGSDNTINYGDTKNENLKTAGYDIVKNKNSYEEIQQKIETIVQRGNEAEEIVKEKTTTQHKDLEGFEKCKGDHKDVDRGKPKTSQRQHTPDKFEYRVNPATAPAWACIRLLAADDRSNCFFDVNKNKNEINPLEIKKWCRDLDCAYEGLKQWSLWIKAACKEVIDLKKKFQGIKKPCAQHYCQSRANEWTRLKRDIDKDTILWSKLYQQAHGTLKTYTEKQKRKINSADPLLSCTCRNTSKRYAAIDC